MIKGFVSRGTRWPKKKFYNNIIRLHSSPRRLSQMRRYGLRKVAASGALVNASVPLVSARVADGNPLYRFCAAWIRHGKRDDIARNSCCSQRLALYETYFVPSCSATFGFSGPQGLSEIVGGAHFGHLSLAEAAQCASTGGTRDSLCGGGGSHGLEARATGAGESLPPHPDPLPRGGEGNNLRYPWGKLF